MDAAIEQFMEHTGQYEWKDEFSKLENMIAELYKISYDKIHLAKQTRMVRELGY